MHLHRGVKLRLYKQSHSCHVPSSCLYKIKTISFGEEEGFRVISGMVCTRLDLGHTLPSRSQKAQCPREGQHLLEPERRQEWTSNMQDPPEHGGGKL